MVKLHHIWSFHTCLLLEPRFLMKAVTLQLANDHSSEEIGPVNGAQKLKTVISTQTFSAFFSEQSSDLCLASE